MSKLFFYLSDGSGMDFRSMLQKKRYAKNQAKDPNPDWGDLKNLDKEPETILKKVEKVSLVVK